MARYFRIERCEADNVESSEINLDDALGSETDLAA
jgi:hypothetical protein